MADVRLGYNKIDRLARCGAFMREYAERHMPNKRGIYASSRRIIVNALDDAAKFIGDTGAAVGYYPHISGYKANTDSKKAVDIPVSDPLNGTLPLWNSQSDAMPPFKPKTPVSVTVEILTSDNKVVKAIYDARVSIWLSAEEWYKPEQVVGWRCLADG